MDRNAIAYRVRIGRLYRVHAGVYSVGRPPRTALERDRRRDADTLAAGLATIRITWPRLAGKPAREAARLKAILAQRRER